MLREADGRDDELHDDGLGDGDEDDLDDGDDDSGGPGHDDDREDDDQDDLNDDDAGSGDGLDPVFDRSGLAFGTGSSTRADNLAGTAGARSIDALGGPDRVSAAAGTKPSAAAATTGSAAGAASM